MENRSWYLNNIFTSMLKVILLIWLCVSFFSDVAIAINIAILFTVFIVLAFGLVFAIVGTFVLSMILDLYIQIKSKNERTWFVYKLSLNRNLYIDENEVWVLYGYECRKIKEIIDNHRILKWYYKCFCNNSFIESIFN